MITVGGGVVEQYFPMIGVVIEPPSYMVNVSELKKVIILLVVSSSQWLIELLGTYLEKGKGGGDCFFAKVKTR